MIKEDRPPDHLLELWNQARAPRVLIVGDVMLDRYVHGPVDRISQEAPVMVLTAEQTESRLGGAANVAAMAAAFKSQVTCAGVVGDDEASNSLRGELEAHGITPLLLTDSTRPTTVKQRFVGRAAHRHPSQVLRVDFEATHDIDAARSREWLEQVSAAVSHHDVVVISDYAKGCCPQHIVQAIMAAARTAAIPVLVDPGRGRRLDHYSGCTLLKPNRFEAGELLGMPRHGWENLSGWIERAGKDWPFDHLLVTLDAEGMLLCPRGGPARHLATRPRAVYDITGAGDAVIAALAVGWGSGLAPEEATWLGNLAGGIEVEQPGVTPVSRRQIAGELATYREPAGGKVRQLEQVAEACRMHQASGERVVLTNGCFDLLHYGHVQYLQEAREQGDRLVVAINSDASVRRLKGSSRPVIEQTQRAAMLAALGCVDYVVIFDEPTPHDLLRAIRPDLLVKGGTYSVDEVVGKEVVEEYGGAVAVLGLVDGLSTTRIVESIRTGAQLTRRAG